MTGNGGDGCGVQEERSARGAAKPERSYALRALQGVNRLYARVYHSVEVIAPPQLPARGAAILVCNHTSGIDPELIQSCCSRVITWMMAREYYEMPVLRNV